MLYSCAPVGWISEIFVLILVFQVSREWFTRMVNSICVDHLSSSSICTTTVRAMPSELLTVLYRNGAGSCSLGFKHGMYNVSPDHTAHDALCVQFAAIKSEMTYIGWPTNSCVQVMNLSDGVIERWVFKVFYVLTTCSHEMYSCGC